MSELTIEPIGPIRVTVPRGSDPDTIVTVDGVPQNVAEDIDWGGIIDVGIAIGKKIFGGDGGGGGGGDKGKGCVTFGFSTDSGSFTGKYCPA